MPRLLRRILRHNHTPTVINHPAGTVILCVRCKAVL